MPRDAFEQLEASLLFCPKCRTATPVRKRLLLILPQGNKFEYLAKGTLRQFGHSPWDGPRPAQPGCAARRGLRPTP